MTEKKKKMRLAKEIGQLKRHIAHLEDLLEELEAVKRNLNKKLNEANMWLANNPPPKNYEPENVLAWKRQLSTHRNTIERLGPQLVKLNKRREKNQGELQDCKIRLQILYRKSSPELYEFWQESQKTWSHYEGA